jgi:hypothetical protein
MKINEALLGTWNRRKIKREQERVTGEENGIKV